MRIINIEKIEGKLVKNRTTNNLYYPLEITYSWFIFKKKEKVYPTVYFYKNGDNVDIACKYVDKLGKDIGLEKSTQFTMYCDLYYNK